MHPIFKLIQTFECPAEFSSYKCVVLFAEPLCGVPNVPHNKCLNMKVHDADDEQEVRKSVDQYKQYEAVKCALCETTIGVVYITTTALCNTRNV